jgi:hypothetical protein
MTIQFNEGRLTVDLRPNTSPERMVENMKSALARGLREVPACKAHGSTLAIAAGGPSLADTYHLLAGQGHIAAVNGSLKFLLEKGIVPEFCGVLDASPHMAEIVIADPRVRYLVASNCDPLLFDKLLEAGCKVWLWHPTPGSIGTDDGAKLLQETQPGRWRMIAGGCTIGLRWVSIGYMLGYRSFHLHGLDSSFRNDQTHAYADRRCGAWVDANALNIAGYVTSLNFLQQVTDCAHMIELFTGPTVEPTELHVYGEGLLQTCWKHWEANQETMAPSEAFKEVLEC